MEVTYNKLYSSIKHAYKYLKTVNIYPLSFCILNILGPFNNS